MRWVNSGAGGGARGQAFERGQSGRRQTSGSGRTSRRWRAGGAAAVMVILGGSGGVLEARAADPPSAAETGAGAKVTAEDLYQQGLTLAEQGKWAEAAAKLEESNRLDRAPGTTINLADCYEHLGKLASAWTLFVEAATIFNRRTPPDPRGAMAQTRADKLYPDLSRLTIDVPEAVRGLAGLVVRRDGEEVGAAQFGTGVAVDPGVHVVEVSAAGKVTWRGEVKVGAASSNTVSTSPTKATITIPLLADAKAPGGGDAGTGASGGWPWQKKVALGMLGVGAVGIGVGVAAGVDALGKHDALSERCSPGVPRTCDAEGLRIADAQGAVATVSTVGFVAGGVLAAAGVVLWVVAPAAGGDRQGRARSRGRAGGSGVWAAPVVGSEAGVLVGGAW